MKYIVTLIIFTVSLFSQEYFAKIEPLNKYDIKSSVSGKVVLSDLSKEATFIKDDLIIKIDDKVNKIELRQTQSKIRSMNQILKIHKQTLNSFNKVSSKSKFDKDKQKVVILNTQITLADLNTKLQTLKDTINKKNIKVKSLYLNKIYVKKDDYVNPGTLLLSAYDLSKGKLEIFLSKDELKDLQNKTILIDGKKEDIKINKIYKTTDDKHLSSYKVELILNNVSSFSKLVKITIK